MPKAHDSYEQVLRDALEDVFVVAARQAMDTGLLTAEFDVGRDAGPHQEHTLTVTLRDSSIAVTADSIPHEWLSMGTGYIDTRFSKLIARLLQDLEKKVQLTGRVL
jgi:hypothetical protein